MGGEFAGEAGLLPGFAVGSRVAGYRLEERVGAGGMAVVFRARDERLGGGGAEGDGPGVAADEEFRQRFIRESRAAAAVDDPHIIPVYRGGRGGGVLFIAMRYVPGGDVRALLRRAGPLPPGAGRGDHLAGGIGAGRRARRRAGAPRREAGEHAGGRAAGAARSRVPVGFRAEQGRDVLAGADRVGQFLGTPGYSAPEQIAGQAGGRAGRSVRAGVRRVRAAQRPSPFPRDQVAAVIWAQLSEPPPRLTSLRPDLSAAVDDVLARALAKTPDGRYASCCQFADTLCQALGLAPYHSGSIATPVGYGSPGSAGPATPDHGATVSVALTQPPGRPHRHGAPVNPALTRRRLILAGAAAATTAAAGVIAWDRTHATPRSATTGTPTTQPAKAGAGTLIWQGVVPVGSLGNGSPPELAVSDGVVCVAGNDVVYALDAGRGTRKWNYSLPKALSSQGGNTVNLMVANADAVYLACANVIALRLEDGRKIWNFGSGNGCLFAGAGNGAVYAENDFELCALRASDGTQLWSVPADLTASPVASDGMVYVAGGQGNSELIWALHASNGGKAWNSNGGPNGGALAVGRGIVCGSEAGRHGLAAWRVSDGKQLWDYGATGDPVISDEVVYTYQDSQVLALRADDGKTLWRRTIPVEATLAVGRDVIYARINSGLIALRAADGKPIWHFPISFSPDFPAVAPVATADAVYVSNPVFGATKVYALRV